MKYSENGEIISETAATTYNAKARPTKHKMTHNSSSDKHKERQSEKLTGKDENDKTTDQHKHRLNDTPRKQEGRQRRLKKLRRLYQAEIVKHLQFFQSARPYIELGSKPISVQQGHVSAENGQGTAMEQLD